MIRIKCGKCAKALAVKPELAGKRVKCPGCGEPITVPSAPATVPAPAAQDGYALMPGAPVGPGTMPGAAPGMMPGMAPGMMPGMQQMPGMQMPGMPAAGMMPGFSNLSDLLDDAGPGKIQEAPKYKPGEMPCPQCAEAIPQTAVLCVHCGFDMQLGKVKSTKVDTPPSDGAKAAVSIGLAFLWILLINFVASAVTLGTAIPTIMQMRADLNSSEPKVPWWTICVLMLFVGGPGTILTSVSIMADAFSEGWKRGLLCMFVPFYAIYHVASRWHRTRGTYIGLNVTSWFLVLGMLMLIGVPPGLRPKSKLGDTERARGAWEQHLKDELREEREKKSK